jgi:hypothetical protein
MENELAMLNPQVKEVTVGIKKLKKIKIYPLSIHDQSEMTGIISTSLVQLFSLKDADNLKIITFVKDILQENLSKILEYITDEGADLMKSISNSQAIEIAEVVYDVNYGSLEKKTKMFLKKIGGMFQSATLSPQSSETTLNTPSITSSEEAIETEVLQ